MSDRVVYIWMPLLFLLICGLVLLPQTSNRVIRFVVDLLYGL